MKAGGAQAMRNRAMSLVMASGVGMRPVEVRGDVITGAAGRECQSGGDWVPGW